MTFCWDNDSFSSFKTINFDWTYYFTLSYTLIGKRRINSFVYNYIHFDLMEEFV